MKKSEFNYSSVRENNSYVRRDLVSEQNVKDANKKGDKKESITIEEKRRQELEDNNYSSDYFLS